MMLMEEAERIARDEHGSSKLAVISGETQNGFIYPLLGHQKIYVSQVKIVWHVCI